MVLTDRILFATLWEAGCIGGGFFQGVVDLTV